MFFFFFWSKLVLLLIVVFVFTIIKVQFCKIVSLKTLYKQGNVDWNKCKQKNHFTIM
jgi:hypothetical protein